MTLAVNIAQGGSNNVTMRNRIINGAMVINQRGSSSYSVSGQYYTLDRWEGNILGGGTGTFTVTQPTVTLSGFTKALLVTVGTADSSQSANAAYSIEQQIEGYNIADLNFGASNAKPITLSFWVYSSVTGTFPLVIQNGGNTRSYGATYTISSANTWQQIVLTVAGDTTGTWATDNSSGLLIHWGLGGGGSTRTASAGWSTAASINQTMVAGCVSLMATSGATFYITGVQLEAGTTASPFEYRQYGTELYLCQRYFWTQSAAPTSYAHFAPGVYTGTTNADFTVQYPQTMRATPTLTFTAANTFYCDGFASLTPSAMGYAFGTPTNMRMQATVSGATSGQAIMLGSGGSGTAVIQYSAEL